MADETGITLEKYLKDLIRAELKWIEERFRSYDKAVDIEETLKRDVSEEIKGLREDFRTLKSAYDTHKGGSTWSERLIVIIVAAVISVITSSIVGAIIYAVKT